ncbi:MAG: DUF4388 domain-containing protein [Dictyoglomus sp.]|nr:DUF4388 domain-containing protein [Dictyoglomus sp.]MDW8189236.1 DUF4388 domain-containing protein [Dictyoglomus sp.]
MRLEGNLDRIEFLSFINFLSLQRRTGVFLIKDEEERFATVFLKNGDVIDVEYLGERGESAFFKLLSLPEINFVFTETPVKIEKRINLSSENLILEAIKKIDEEKELYITSLLEAI